MGLRLTRLAEAMMRRDFTERAATLAAAVAVGQSFAPSLLPRKPLQQAVVTGLSASLVYGAARTSQSAIESAAELVVPGVDTQSFNNRKVLAASANGIAVLLGIAVQRAVPRRRGEPVKRATVRTLGWQLSAAGSIGLGLTGVAAAVDVLLRRTGRVHPLVVPTGFILGSVVAAGEIAWYRRRQPETPPVFGAVAQGMGVMTGVTVLSVTESVTADAVAGLVRRVAPGFAGLAEPIGHATALAPLVGGLWAGLEWVNHRTEQGGAAVEQAYQRPPTSLTASGGPSSGIDWATLGREGRRYVNMVLPAKEITAVTGQAAKDPIRVFVGLESAATVDARVSAAIDELEALGAFSRKLICLASPTGTGYVNYVAAESMEYLTGGDCATVCLQYSLRPSFLSLDRVALGREQNRALLHALNGRLRAIPAAERPRFVAMGESLGAFTLQDAFLHEGTAGLHRAGIDRALFIGTPAESKWAEQWRLDPERADPGSEVVEVASWAEWLELPADIRERARYFLLSHHEDPITKFSPAIAVQAPDWMSRGADRSPAVPDGVQWRPFTTFLLTTVDVLNASDVVPGHFSARGHDYRSDLARFTSLAFDLPCDEAMLTRMETALRRRELLWAERRVVAEQFAQARESIQRQLRSWSATDPAEQSTPSAPVRA
ncbi:MAG: hypothetical protein QG671_3877 [Actinomycetota bacterium]|nr:hypothetical protein [Actinomycetota bacterium]HQZ85596.1 alpha/beta-hydrolase family protein [Actinomycetota bacterium]